MSPLKQPLCGILPPMIPPLLDRHSLDVEGLQKLITYVLRGGVNGIFVLGCNDFVAEPFHRFRDEERQAIRKHLQELGLSG